MLFELECQQRVSMGDIYLLKDSIKNTRVSIETKPCFNHLKEFLFEDADTYIQEQIASVYGLYIDDEVRWYMSLSVAVCKVEDFYWQGQVWDPESPKFPGLLIGKLLIDDKLQWQWYGKKFISLSVSLGNELSKLVGIRCIIVDANLEAIEFYEKMGFIEIAWTKNKETTKMILDLKGLYS